MALKRISDYVSATLPLAGTEMLELETADGQARKVAVSEVGGGGGGSGDVVGPATSTDNFPALFDGATGKLLKQGASALGSAAYAATGAFATAAQGANADSAVQPWALAAVATSGAYADLSGAPTIPAQVNPIAGTNVTITGTYPNLTFSAAGGGGGGSTQGKQGIYVAAAAMRPALAGACAPIATVATSANQPDILTLNFDPSTAENAQFSLAMPKKWNKGTITFKPYWSHAATTTNFGVAWTLQAVGVGNDDTIQSTFGTEQASVDTGGTTDDLYIGPESSAITVAGTLGDEDMVFFRVSRAPTNAGDTMAVDARLHGIMVYAITNADTDA